MSAAAAETAPSVALRAERLQDLWSQLAMRHVALGGACGCGAGGVSLRLDDFEPDIVGYLDDAGRRSGVAAVAAFFAARPLEAGGAALRDLLDELAADQVPPEAGAWLIARLETTLHSYAELHGPRA